MLTSGRQKFPLLHFTQSSCYFLARLWQVPNLIIFGEVQYNIFVYLRAQDNILLQILRLLIQWAFLLKLKYLNY